MAQSSRQVSRNFLNFAMVRFRSTGNRQRNRPEREIGSQSQSKHQNETKSEKKKKKSETNMVFAQLRPASGRFPVSRNETKVQIARFVSMSSLNPRFCIVPWAPYGKALVTGGVVLRDLKRDSSKTG